MATLRLRSITCIEQAETFTDELYVTFNGTKRSLPNMSRGQTDALSDEFLFDGERQLSLFENDGDHWYDRDDFIAKHAITQSPADLSLDFIATSGDAIDAHYALSVSITPDPPIQMSAILRLRSITCIEQAETFTDELYVTFNGTKRSLPNMTQGQTEELSDEFLFEGSPELSLFENDGDHWYDRDDFIAKHTITRSPADLTLDFIATSGDAGGCALRTECKYNSRPLDGASEARYRRLFEMAQVGIHLALDQIEHPESSLEPVVTVPGRAGSASLKSQSLPAGPFRCRRGFGRVPASSRAAPVGARVCEFR